MLDQSFSAENFRRIFDLENRRGRNFDEQFFPTLQPLTQQIHLAAEAIGDLRRRKASMSHAQFEQELLRLKLARDQCKRAKSDAVDALLESVAEEVRRNGFRIGLTAHQGPKGKTVYPIDHSPGSFFAIKQLQRNLNRLYGVKQANRHQVVCQVRDTISSQFPLEMIRTDIKGFYENVDRARLTKKLDEDQLLSLGSKRLIRQVLQQYESLSGEPRGIPRGVGVSAYLGELYLRPIDRLIRSIEGVILYVRYVDDIVIVFSRPPKGQSEPYLPRVTAIFSEHGLELNEKKTREVVLPHGPMDFEYLGYRFRRRSGEVMLSPSLSKLVKLRKRIDISFDKYADAVHVSSRKAARELAARIKFLTANTRLRNSKSHAVTGIFFGNSAATDISGLARLDAKLLRLASATGNSHVQAVAGRCSFVRGHSERVFRSFTTHEMKRIVEAWKDVE